MDTFLFINIESVDTTYCNPYTGTCKTFTGLKIAE